MAEEAKPKTAADAAKLVHRTATDVVDGKKRTKKVAVSGDEVLSFHDHGSHVVVVTRDGQKLSSAGAEAST